MLSEKDLYPYQKHCVKHIIDHPYSGLFLEMGLGKTISTLTAINRLKFDYFEVDKVLVIAPKRVCEEVWPEEIKKWEHIQHLKMSVAIGSAKERRAALRQEADIYVINRENVSWIVSYYGTKFPFDTLVLDELSSFKSHRAARFKALKVVRPLIHRVIGLTGTPSPNTLMDLWSQMYLLDRGERLGERITAYRQKYFKPNQRNGHIVYNYTLKKDMDKDLFGKDYYKKEIYDKISDISISMKSKDYLDLPETIYRERKIELPGKVLEAYKEFERTKVLELLEDNDITAVNAAALSTKLLQYANGALYDDEKVWYEVHKAKLETIEEIISTATSPVLVFYWFKHDLERLEKHLSKYKPVNIKTPGAVKKWNRQEIPVMLAHPASSGHGLNLQHGGHTIVWFSQTWSLELYQQANARLPRPGQKHPVIIHNLICSGTMDTDVMKARQRKDEGQAALMDEVKARMEKYK